MSTPEDRTNKRYQDAIDHAKSVSGFGFEIALAALKNGCHARRLGWNRKGMHIELQEPDEHSKMTQPYLFLVIAPRLNEMTGQASWGAPQRIPWLASQADLLMDDWQYMVPGGEFAADPDALLRSLMKQPDYDYSGALGGTGIQRPADCACPPEGYRTDCPHAERHEANARHIRDMMRPPDAP